jgi:hypothetical protein
MTAYGVDRSGHADLSLSCAIALAYTQLGLSAAREVPMHDSNSSRTVTRTSREAVTSRGHFIPLRMPGLLWVLLTEFRRAHAAAQRYERLRNGLARQEKLASANIPRRIFAEFYAVEASQ